MRFTMHADYPKKLAKTSWDTLNLEYPITKFPSTCKSSETIGHQWRGQPEVIRSLLAPMPEQWEYDRNYNVTNELTRSQTTLDFGCKHPEGKIINKHTSSSENLYIYPSSKRLADRPPQCRVHGTSEMRSSYVKPTIPARLVTSKEQYKHPASLPSENLMTEPSWQKDLEPLDTTHDGYEKYLDPYLSTSRLHHRPYTADQLNRPSASRDIVTYYTYSKEPWVHTPKSIPGDWRLPLSCRPKSMYDREKFKQDFREIRTHNKQRWVPGTFRTETRDNYVQQTSRPESQIHNSEEEVRTFFERSMSKLPTNEVVELSTIKQFYTSENSQFGSGKPICSVFEQHSEKNKRLERIDARGIVHEKANGRL